jgi:hypothetical protein
MALALPEEASITELQWGQRSFIACRFGRQEGTRLIARDRTGACFDLPAPGNLHLRRVQID